MQQGTWNIFFCFNILSQVRSHCGFIEVNILELRWRPTSKWRDSVTVHVRTEMCILGWKNWSLNLILWNIILKTLYKKFKISQFLILIRCQHKPQRPLLCSCQNMKTQRLTSFSASYYKNVRWILYKYTILILCI